MERRGFLKSLAAGMATPMLAPLAVVGQPMIPWDLFCDPTYSRFDLSAPWFAQGRMIASDARILVSEPGSGGGGQTRRVPNLSSLPWDQFDATGWTSVFGLQRSQGIAECERCFGRRRINAVRCACQTRARITDSRGQLVHRCHDCVGSGWLGPVCPQCDGGGESEFCYMLGDQRFNPNYIGRIKTIGDVDCRLVQSDDETKSSIMLFRFGTNGYGMLCCVR